jgi:hypothetical protein
VSCTGGEQRGNTLCHVANAADAAGKRCDGGGLPPKREQAAAAVLRNKREDSVDLCDATQTPESNATLEVLRIRHMNGGSWRSRSPLRVVEAMRDAVAPGSRGSRLFPMLRVVAEWRWSARQAINTSLQRRAPMRELVCCEC